ncbi:MAG: hypothetical protein IT437_09955 [Phycisphaerales bacterium]|nr:hypothetical protein [Phycisphaerales bacterium]
MNEHRNNLGTPEPLRGVGALLDALAASERASAPSGVEARVFAATRGAIAAPALREPKGVIATIRPSGYRLFTPLRVAAGLALVAASGAIWLAGMRGGAAGSAGATSIAERYESLDSKVETLLAWKSPMGDGFEGLGEQIDLIYADLSDLSVDTGFSGDLFIDGGAM